MDRATSRSGRPLRRRHDGVDADCAGAAAPSRGGNRSATGHRYRQTVAAVSRLVAGTRRPVFVPGPPRPLCHLDARRARLHASDGGAMEPDNQEILAVVRWSRPRARESDGRRHRQLCRHPGNGPLGARLDSQRDLGLVRVPALRCPGGVVLEPIGRIDFPASALSAGVFAICPGLVCRSADAGRRRHGQATGYP